MAITKVSRGLLNTGISDSSDATAITIDSSERVGIGLTSPASPLHVRVASDANFEVENASGSVRLAALNDARSVNVNMEFTSTHFGFLTGNLGLGTTTINSGTLGTANKFLEVAAGTANGSGTIVLSRTTNGNNNEIGGLRFVNSANADDDGLDSDGKLVAAVSARSVTSDSNASDDSGAALHFYTKPEAGNYAERMRIYSDGYISMTRSASEYGLQLKSTGTRSGLVVMKPGTDTIMGSVLLIGSNEYFSLGTASYYHVQCFQNGRTHIVGDYSFGGSNVSDRDMKENIIEVEGTSLEKILKLPIKSFKYKETDTEAHHISGNVQERKQKTGFIAQEVQPHLPDVVTGTDGKGDMALDPMGITAHLVRALQEQQAIIEDLQKQINEVKNDN